MNSSKTLVSGGANGADQEFERIVSNLSETGIIIIKNSSALSKIDIAENDSILKQINKFLKRTYPSKNSYVNSLLLRDAQVGKIVTSVYAIGTLSKEQITGGTAWACHSHLFKVPEPKLYFFEQNLERWFFANSTENGIPKWEILDKPPTPTGVYAGIGTRELLHAGKKAIEEIYRNCEN